MLLHFFLDRSVGHSLLFAVSAWAADVSICFTTLPRLGRQVRDSQRDRLAHRPPGNDPGVALSKALGRVGPHAMQNDGQFAGDRDSGSCHAAPPGDVHAPCSEARPLLRSHQQCVGRLIKRGACKFVAASADLSLDVGFAGLVACRRQSQMRPHRLRRAEPLRPVDRGAEGERRDRP